MRDKILEALFLSVDDKTEHVDIDTAANKIFALFSVSLDEQSEATVCRNNICKGVPTEIEDGVYFCGVCKGRQTVN